jgi:hypothetical protein
MPHLFRVFANDARIGHTAGVVPHTGRDPFEGQIIACVQYDEDSPKQWVVVPFDEDDPFAFFALAEELV